jgi:hypothetical protein
MTEENEDIAAHTARYQEMLDRGRRRLTAPELVAGMDALVALYGKWPPGVRDALLRGLNLQLNEAADAAAAAERANEKA